MAERKALVQIAGQIQELPAGDTLQGAGSGGGGNVDAYYASPTTLDLGGTPSTSTSAFASKGNMFTVMNPLRITGVNFDIEAGGVGEPYEAVVAKMSSFSASATITAIEKKTFTATAANETISFDTPMQLVEGEVVFVGLTKTDIAANNDPLIRWLSNGNSQTSNSWLRQGSSRGVRWTDNTLALGDSPTDLTNDWWAVKPIYEQLNALIPAGGTAGQMLAKTDGVDFNAEWVDPPSGGSGSGLPAGGSVNQILMKTGVADGEAGWNDVRSFLAQPQQEKAPSYSNEFGMGARNGAGQLKVTTTFTTASGVVSTMIDGGYNNAWYWTTQTAAGKEFKVEFPYPVKINAARWRQSTSTNHGVVRWEGSPDGVTWTALSADVTLGGSTSAEYSFTAWDGTTEYKFFRFIGVSGTMSSSPWLHEIEFSVGEPAKDGYVSVPMGGTTGQALIKQSDDDHDVVWGDVAAGGSGGGSSTPTVRAEMYAVAADLSGYSRSTLSVFNGPAVGTLEGVTNNAGVFSITEAGPVVLTMSSGRGGGYEIAVAIETSTDNGSTWKQVSRGTPDNGSSLDSNEAGATAAYACLAAAGQQFRFMLAAQDNANWVSASIMSLGGGSSASSGGGASTPHGGKTVVEVPWTDYSQNLDIDLTDCDEVEIIAEMWQASHGTAVFPQISADGTTFETSYDRSQVSAGNAESVITDEVGMGLVAYGSSSVTQQNIVKLTDFKGAIKTKAESKLISSNYNTFQTTMSENAVVHTVLRLPAQPNNTPTGGRIFVRKISYAVGGGSGSGSSQTPLGTFNPVYMDRPFENNPFTDTVHGAQTINVVDGKLEVRGSAQDSWSKFDLTKPFTHCVFKMTNQHVSIPANAAFQDGGVTFHQTGAANYFHVGVGTNSSGTDHYLRILEWSASNSAFVSTLVTDIDMNNNDAEIWCAVIKAGAGKVRIMYSLDGLHWAFVTTLTLSTVDGMTDINSIGVRSGSGDDFDLTFMSEDEHPYQVGNGEKGDPGADGQDGQDGVDGTNANIYGENVDVVRPIVANTTSSSGYNLKGNQFKVNKDMQITKVGFRVDGVYAGEVIAAVLTNSNTGQANAVIQRISKTAVAATVANTDTLITLDTPLEVKKDEYVFIGFVRTDSNNLAKSGAVYTDLNGVANWAGYGADDNIEWISSYRANQTLNYQVGTLVNDNTNNNDPWAAWFSYELALYIGHAPADGNQYVSKDGEWTLIDTSHLDSEYVKKVYEAAQFASHTQSAGNSGDAAAVRFNTYVAKSDIRITGIRTGFASTGGDPRLFVAKVSNNGVGTTVQLTEILSLTNTLTVGAANPSRVDLDLVTPAVIKAGEAFCIGTLQTTGSKIMATVLAASDPYENDDMTFTRSHYTASNLDLNTNTSRRSTNGTNWLMDINYQKEDDGKPKYARRSVAANQDITASTTTTMSLDTTVINKGAWSVNADCLTVPAGIKAAEFVAGFQLNTSAGSKNIEFWLEKSTDDGATWNRFCYSRTQVEAWGGGNVSSGVVPVSEGDRVRARIWSSGSNFTIRATEVFLSAKEVG